MEVGQLQLEEGGWHLLRKLKVEVGSSGAWLRAFNLRLRCLFIIKVEWSRRQLDIWVWSSAERSGLEIQVWELGLDEITSYSREGNRTDGIRTEDDQILGTSRGGWEMEGLIHGVRWVRANAQVGLAEWCVLWRAVSVEWAWVQQERGKWRLCGYLWGSSLLKEEQKLSRISRRMLGQGKKSVYLKWKMLQHFLRMSQ